jgi:hypothetical protein
MFARVPHTEHTAGDGVQSVYRGSTLRDVCVCVCVCVCGGSFIKKD